MPIILNCSTFAAGVTYEGQLYHISIANIVACTVSCHGWNSFEIAFGTAKKKWQELSPPEQEKVYAQFESVYKDSLCQLFNFPFTSPI